MYQPQNVKAKPVIMKVPYLLSFIDAQKQVRTEREETIGDLKRRLASHDGVTNHTEHISLAVVHLRSTLLLFFPF